MVSPSLLTVALCIPDGLTPHRLHLCGLERLVSTPHSFCKFNIITPLLTVVHSKNRIEDMVDILESIQNDDVENVAYLISNGCDHHENDCIQLSLLNGW